MLYYTTYISHLVGLESSLVTAGELQLGSNYMYYIISMYCRYNWAMNEYAVIKQST